jgi:UDP-glucose 4-epimerase
MRVLVTGGAGYIGSAAVKSLIEQNYEVVVVDNLSKGDRELVNEKAKFYELDLTDREGLKEVFKENEIDAVIHFAGYKAVGDSMRNAVKYSDNIVGTINLLNLMVEFGVPKIIFSSSAAVYGISDKEVIDESTMTKPINFYGFAKLECEKIMEWFRKIHGIDYISLRYFNVVGDGGLNYIDAEAQNLFPIIMEVIVGIRQKLQIFGNDYATRDGTCIRDYIDINDLVDAHILALNAGYNGAINLGTGRGYTVNEIVKTFTEVTGENFLYEYGERRAGDPASLIASNNLAERKLNWKPKRDLKQSVQSTYKAYLQNN